VVIKVSFAILLLSIAAIVAVTLAIHFRIRRHLKAEKSVEPPRGERHEIDSPGGTKGQDNPDEHSS
jgi:hypothetical protein